MHCIAFSQIFISADINPAKVEIADKDFSKELDFKNIHFPVKIRVIHKIEKIKLYQH